MAALGFLGVLVLLAVGLGLSLLLWHFVRSEHDQRETMDRDAAERVARRDTDDGNREFRK